MPAGTIGDDPDSRPEHAARHLPAQPRRVVHPDGYYPTGDLGHLDDDGFMFYHGRSDDMFKVSGATVYPSEVEQALRSIDGVDNAFVTNVSPAASIGSAPPWWAIPPSISHLWRPRESC